MIKTCSLVNLRLKAIGSKGTAFLLQQFSKNVMQSTLVDEDIMNFCVGPYIADKYSYLL